MAPIQVFVQIRRPHRSYGYYCAICPFSSGGNIIQKKKNPTQIMTCAPAYGLGTSNDVWSTEDLTEHFIISYLVSHSTTCVMFFR